MLSALAILIFLTWPIVLGLTLLPGLIAGWFCVWRMVAVRWWVGSMAGVLGGMAGAVVGIGWYWLTFAYQQHEFATSGASVLVYFLLPIPSAATAWGFCLLWNRRAAGIRAR